MQFLPSYPFAGLQHEASKLGEILQRQFKRYVPSRVKFPRQETMIDEGFGDGTLMNCEAGPFRDAG